MATVHFGSRGAKVKAIQRALLEAGHELPKWGADGDLGAETWIALMAFAQARKIAWPKAEHMAGDVPSAVIEALFAPASPVVEPPAPSGSEPPLPQGAVDVRGEHELTKGRSRPRSPGQITGIVLHQTATHLGERAHRWHHVACHLGVTRKGQVIVVNDLRAYVWHAHGGNKFGIGIEIDGRYEGVAGKPKTLWGHSRGITPDPLDGAQIDAARSAVRWAVDAARALGCPLHSIWAHRQFSDQRTSDPGSAIWQEVGLWAQRELGLKAHVDKTLGTGRPIPVEWDPSSTHRYSRR